MVMVFSVARRSPQDSIMKTSLSLIVIFTLWTVPPQAKCDYPGTFFWQPRLGLDFNVPSSTFRMRTNGQTVHLMLSDPVAHGHIQPLESCMRVVNLGVLARAPVKDRSLLKPSVLEIKRGLAVLVRGYDMGTTALALAMNVKRWEKFPHLNPFKAWFYTTAYRWLLRHLSIYPKWLKDERMTYIDTHRVWRKRFTQLNTFVPEWIQWLLPHVWEWDRERKQFRRYSRYAEGAFSKHYHYPKADFDYWASEQTTETVENLDIDNRSIGENIADY